MASNDECAQYLEDRMEDLNDERRALHQVLDKYTDHIMAQVTTWLYYKGERGPNYKEMIGTLDRCMSFVLRKSGETNAELATEKTGVVATSSSSQPSDLFILQLFERVENLEKDMNTMSGIDQGLDGVKNEMKEVLKRVRECDQSNRKLEDRITELTDGVDDLSGFKSSEQEDKINKSKDSGRMKPIREKMNRGGSQLSEMKDKMNDRSDSLKKNEEIISRIQRRMVSKEKEQLEEVKKLKENLNTSENRSKEMEKQMLETDKKLKGMDAERKKDVNELRKNLNTSESTSKKLEKQMLEIEEKLKGKEAEGKKDVNELRENLNRYEEKRRKDNIKLEKLESHVKQEEEERRTEKNKNRETMMKFGNRLSSLEDEKLGDMKSEFSALSSRVEVVKKRQEHHHQPTVGFTAQVPATSYPILTGTTVVTNFTEIVTQKGDHYNPLTGVFIAPVDGLYVAGLSHYQCGDGHRALRMYRERVIRGQAGGGGVEVCGTWTEVNNTSCSSLGVVSMGKGDKLYVEVSAVTGSRLIGSPSNFSCFLLG